MDWLVNLEFLGQHEGVCLPKANLGRYEMSVGRMKYKLSPLIELFISMLSALF